jgi:hypothetical protein
MAPRRDAEQRIGLSHHENSLTDDEEGIEFANYAESDDDDEDPYFMPEHTKKSHTLSFSRYATHIVCLLMLINVLII